MFYVVTLSESQKVMRWRLIIEYFGSNIHHIAGVDNIVSETISRLPYMRSNMYKPCTRKSQCHANELFAIGRLEKTIIFLLNILIAQIEQQK